jgi:hypothetical protein
MFSEYLPNTVELVCLYTVASYMFHIQEMAPVCFDPTPEVLTATEEVACNYCM